MGRIVVSSSRLPSTRQYTGEDGRGRAGDEDTKDEETIEAIADAPPDPSPSRGTLRSASTKLSTGSKYQ
jgi:hypothetical protein